MGTLSVLNKTANEKPLHFFKEQTQILNIMLEKLEAYKEGMMGWDEYVKTGYERRPNNPYTFNTENWKAWNRGWNTNMNGIE